MTIAMYFFVHKIKSNFSRLFSFIFFIHFSSAMKILCFLVLLFFTEGGGVVGFGKRRRTFDVHWSIKIRAIDNKWNWCTIVASYKSLIFCGNEIFRIEIEIVSQFCNFTFSIDLKIHKSLNNIILAPESSPMNYKWFIVYDKIFSTFTSSSKRSPFWQRTISYLLFWENMININSNCRDFADRSSKRGTKCSAINHAKKGEWLWCHPAYQLDDDWFWILKHSIYFINSLTFLFFPH